MADTPLSSARLDVSPGRGLYSALIIDGAKRQDLLLCFVFHVISQTC